MAALRAQQNREWRERREEARKEEVAPLIHLSNNNHDDDDDGNDDGDDIILAALLNEQELSGRCCDVERDCGVEEALRQELRQRSSLHCLVLWATL